MKMPLERKPPSVPLTCLTPFVYLIREAGLRDQAVPRRVMLLNRAVGVLDGDREVMIYPAEHLRITYTIDFAHIMMKQNISTAW